MNSTNDTKTSLIDKIKSSGWVIAVFFMVLSMFQTCSLSRKVADLKKKAKEYPTREEIITQFQIEGLRTSKRMLYDNNAIIRTTVRPDDRMNEYDAEIKKLQGK